MFLLLARDKDVTINDSNESLSKRTNGTVVASQKIQDISKIFRGQLYLIFYFHRIFFK